MTRSNAGVNANTGGFISRDRLVQVGWTRFGQFFALDPDPENHADDVSDRTLEPVFVLIPLEGDAT